jgi:hypothetical protein
MITIIKVSSRCVSETGAEAEIVIIKMMKRSKPKA